jgi:hypothetical protein
MKSCYECAKSKECRVWVRVRSVAYCPGIRWGTNERLAEVIATECCDRFKEKEKGGGK